MPPYESSKEDAAPSAASAQRPTSTTSTTPDACADYSATDATQESECSETLKRAWSRHSDICAARKASKPIGLGLSVDRPPDDWRDEANWYKANPGLGTIKSLDTMRSLFREANERSDARIPFQRFNLNLRVQNVLAPISAAKWAECRGPDDWRALREKMRGKSCYLGVDLAETNDMVGLVAWFPEDRVVLPWYWGCERAASERFKRNEPVYYRWRDAGALDLVSDDAIELAPIVAKVEELKTTYEVLGMGVDRAKALEFTFAVQKFGIAPTFVGQGYLTMTEPCDRLVAMVENRRFVHGGHPVLNWNAENLRFKVTGQRAKQPQKPTEAQKIDGIAAWLTALALTMGDAVANAAPPASVEFVSLVRPGRGDFDDEEF